MRLDPVLRPLAGLALCVLTAGAAFANATTPNLGLNKPTVGADSDAWGGYLNANADLLDAELNRAAPGDAAYAMTPANRYVALTTTLTAPRIWTLPAAGAMKTGQAIVVMDEAGGVTSTNTLTIARAGSDTIDGAASYVLTTTSGVAVFRSDGVSKWTVGFSPKTVSGAWTPTVAFATPGTSSFSYTTQFGRFICIGDTVSIEFSIVFTPTIGSASGIFMITGLPYLASSQAGGGVITALSSSTWTWGSGSPGLGLASATQIRVTLLSSSAGLSTFTTSNLTGGAQHTIWGAMSYKTTVC
jgi:hypothetical protein